MSLVITFVHMEYIGRSGLVGRNDNLIVSRLTRPWIVSLLFQPFVTCQGSITFLTLSLRFHGIKISNL